MLTEFLTLYTSETKRHTGGSPKRRLIRDSAKAWMPPQIHRPFGLVIKSFKRAASPRSFPPFRAGTVLLDVEEVMVGGEGRPDRVPGRDVILFEGVVGDVARRKDAPLGGLGRALIHPDLPGLVGIHQRDD